MSIFDELSDLMTDTVSIAPRIGEDTGDADFGSYVVYTPCQVVKGPFKYRSANGDLVIGKGQIILGPTPLVKGDSRIKFDNGELASVLNVTVYPDETGKPFQLVIF